MQDQASLTAKMKFVADCEKGWEMINVKTALAMAREDFARGLPSVMALKAGVLMNNAGRLVVPFFGREYVLPVQKGEEIPAVTEILLLHYLTRASGELPGGEKISFKELPDGFIYNTPFSHRVIRPLVAAFGSEPHLLLRAGVRLGGTAVPFGDAAVEVPALPRVPLTFIIWGGDEEFPANGGVLFDATVSGYLSTEDCVVLAQAGVSALRAALKAAE